MKTKYSIKAILSITLVLLLTIITPILHAQTQMDIQQYKKTQLQEYNSGDEYATVYLKTGTSQENRLQREPIATLSLSQAEQLKNELQDIQNMVGSTEEKIQRQIEILHTYQILPPEVTYDEFKQILQELENRYTNEQVIQTAPRLLSITPDIVTGPSIWSLAGSPRITYPLHWLLSNMLRPIYMERIQGFPMEMEQILGNSSINTWLYAMGLFDPASYYTSTLGLISGTVLIGKHMFLSPFFSLQLCSVGLIIEIVGLKNLHPTMIFSYVLGASLCGSVYYLNKN